jgi:mannose-1-phosphate guanylyltransferase
MSISVVILAGGSGTRLWPLSRSMLPKQFLSLVDEKTMLQKTIKRIDKLNVDSITIITNEEHRFLVSDQTKNIKKPVHIILEPFSKNTAAAICLAAMYLKKDATMLVLSADHIIKDSDKFIHTVNDAIRLAKDGYLVTLGAKPNSPQTEYGYIKPGRRMGFFSMVDTFCEKPNIEKAKEYYNSGEYLWNSGIFLFTSEKYLTELKIYSKEIYDTCKLSMQNIEDYYEYIKINETHFKECPNISIDYAIMEKTDKAAVIPLETEWTDLGSWHSLWEFNDKDEDNNYIFGDVINSKTKNSYISSENQLIATLGVNNLIIIATKDSIMVADKKEIPNIKNIIQKMKVENRVELDFHREVYRPWGKYDSLDSGLGYQVKKITVKPGAKLSTQYHHHRSEHWVVVSGTATVTKGNETFDLEENQSTYINVEEIHSLENKRDIDLEIIEVQSGNYLGEDDIVRIEDKYDRK